MEHLPVLAGALPLQPLSWVGALASVLSLPSTVCLEQLLPAVAEQDPCPFAVHRQKVS